MGTGNECLAVFRRFPDDPRGGLVHVFARRFLVNAIRCAIMSFEFDLDSSSRPPKSWNWFLESARLKHPFAFRAPKL